VQAPAPESSTRTVKVRSDPQRVLTPESVAGLGVQSGLVTSWLGRDTNLTVSPAVATPESASGLMSYDDYVDLACSDSLYSSPKSARAEHPSLRRGSHFAIGPRPESSFGKRGIVVAVSRRPKAHAADSPRPPPRVPRAPRFDLAEQLANLSVRPKAPSVEPATPALTALDPTLAEASAHPQVTARPWKSVVNSRALPEQPPKLWLLGGIPGRPNAVLTAARPLPVSNAFDVLNDSTDESVRDVSIKVQFRDQVKKSGK
jgi:hypothetical protein